MASNNVFEELLSQIPVSEIAQKLGVDEATATAAVKQALPGLVGGMAVNASSEEGQQKLAGALTKHTPASGSGKISLDAIDTEDGKKIVKHVLGDKEEAVAMQLGAQSGGLDIGKLIPMLLPMLAPIVMQFLAGRIGGGQAASQTDQGGGLGDLLGGLLGGSGQGNTGGGLGGGLGDILGGLLGGGGSNNNSKQSGGLGDLLGGLFGK